VAHGAGGGAHLRRQGYGKIVNVSSPRGGCRARSCRYAATKHAIEAMSGGWRAGGLGAQVTIEPGMHASDWQTTNLDVCERAHRASAYTQATERAIGGFGPWPPGTRVGRVAAAIADIVQLQQPLRCAGRWVRTVAHDRRPAPLQRWRRVGGRGCGPAGWGFAARRQRCRQPTPGR
jgi:NAD(P)-dependent dehydrogenase (short-subunit alcohol dehydrogenase family)